MWVKNDLVLVFGSKLTWFMWGIEIYLVYVGDRNLLDFSVGMGIDLVLMWGSKKTWLSLVIEINLVLVSRHQN